MISFDNTERAFAYRSKLDLSRADLLFSTLSNPFFVKAGSGLILGMLKIGLPVGWLVKPSIYKHFVGGETISECLTTAGIISEYGVKCILDFAAEALNSNEAIEKTLDETLKTIEVAAVNPNVPFAVFKPSAFVLHGALQQIAGLSEQNLDITQAKKDFETRVEKLCSKAHELNVPIMIDAEESWFQEYYDEVLLAMMRKYNTQKAIVYNTLQMYRNDRLDYLKQLIALAEKENFFVGIKFVRGAYMEKERERALEKGYDSPICATKEDTDANYNNALSVSINALSRVSIFNGTHNEESCKHLCQLMADKELKTDDARIWFSQLYGMSDHISLNLAHAGYLTAKYLPYGPVKLLVPYLLRRAQENTSVAGQTGRELELIRREKKRRKK